MKLAKSKLKQIIKEELNKVLKEEPRQINEWPWGKKKKAEPEAEAEADPCSYAKQLFVLAARLASSQGTDADEVAQMAIRWKHPDCDFSKDLPDPKSFMSAALNAEQKKEIKGWLRKATEEKEAEKEAAEKKKARAAARKDAWETHRANVAAGRDEYDDQGRANYPRVGE